MSTSDRLSLPYIAPQQAQKHVTHNEAIRRLDAIVQASVKDRDIAVPPSGPLGGDAYIAATGASGDWADGDGALFVYQDGAWVRFDPVPGWIVWIEDEDAAVAWNGSAWIGFGGGGGLSTSQLAAGAADQIGVNTAADSTNRLAAKSDAILFNHDDVTPGSGDCQVKINKATLADTGALLFQTGASGRAEFGLAGDDDFHVKVSADGTSWTDAIVVDSATGRIGLGNSSPQAKLDVGVGSAVPNVNGDELVLRNETGSAGLTCIAADTGNSFLFFGKVSDPDAHYIRFDHASNDMLFYIGGATRLLYDSSDGGWEIFGGDLTVGAPSGGHRGAGTINAEAVYDDNALLSCYVFDQALDGVISLSKWDDKVPDRTIPAAKRSDGDPRKGDLVITRRHTPARRFIAQVGTPEDPLTLDGYAKHWRERRHLPSMPDEATFDPSQGLSAGDWIQRLVEAVEVQAVLIEALNQRTKRNPKR